MLIRPSLLPYSPLPGSRFFLQIFPRSLQLHSLPGETQHPPAPRRAGTSRENKAGLAQGVARGCLVPSVQDWGWAPLSLAAARPGLEWDISAIPT